jgi:hypothetical protein
VSAAEEKSSPVTRQSDAANAAEKRGGAAKLRMKGTSGMMGTPTISNWYDPRLVPKSIGNNRQQDHDGANNRITKVKVHSSLEIGLPRVVDGPRHHDSAGESKQEQYNATCRHCGAW